MRLRFVVSDAAAWCFVECGLAVVNLAVLSRFDANGDVRSKIFKRTGPCDLAFHK
jgi:hypothetical protein